MRLNVARSAHKLHVKLMNWTKIHEQTEGTQVCSFNIRGSPPLFGENRMWVEYWQILFTTSVEGNSKLQTKAIIRGNGEHWTENHLTYRFDLLRPFSLLHLTTVEANRELLESQRKDRLLDSLSFCIPPSPNSSDLAFRSNWFRKVVSLCYTKPSLSVHVYKGN